MSEAIDPEEGSKGSVLIAYFTYGENAPLPDGVDASASASVQLRGDGSLTGNTGLVADMIAKATGGELFSILTAEQYPDNYDDTIDVGQEEKGGSGFSGAIGAIENAEPNAAVLEGLALRDSRSAQAEDDVADWLARIGLAGS